jgi:uncharacterized protein YjiS (DUF1127 family)
MSTPALVTGPKPDTARLDAPTDENLALRLALWVWARLGERVRYHRALHQLRRLDDRDLDDIDIARVDFPGLARRHAGMAG